MMPQTGYGMKGGFDPTKNWGGDKRPKGHKVYQLQQYTPEQMQLFGQGMEAAGPESYLARLAGGDESMFNQLEAPALRQFSGQLGNLSSRFSGMGGLGARNSSGFGQAATSAASNFAQDLQSNRMNLMNQATRDLHSMRQQLLSDRPYERSFYEKPQSSGWGGAIGAGLGGAAGFALGGPAGALAGAQLGYGLGSGGQSTGTPNFGNLTSGNYFGMGQSSNYGAPGYQTRQGPHYNFPGI